jgi:hypothetical protein
LRCENSRHVAGLARCAAVPVRAADPVRGRMKETPSHIELGPEAPAPMCHEHRHYHIHEFELEQHSPEPNGKLRDVQCARLDVHELAREGKLKLGSLRLAVRNYLV